jgi:hypothetical protein
MVKWWLSRHDGMHTLLHLTASASLLPQHQPRRSRRRSPVVVSAPLLLLLVSSGCQLVPHDRLPLLGRQCIHPGEIGDGLPGQKPLHDVCCHRAPLDTVPLQLFKHCADTIRRKDDREGFGQSTVAAYRAPDLWSHSRVTVSRLSSSVRSRPVLFA